MRHTLLAALLATFALPAAASPAAATLPQAFVNEYCTAWATAYNHDKSIQRRSAGLIATPTFGSYHLPTKSQLERIDCFARVRFAHSTVCFSITLQGPATENGLPNQPTIVLRVSCTPATKKPSRLSS